MNRITKTLLHLAALLLFIGFTADTARAQQYAAANGTGVACTPANPCDLQTAIDNAAPGEVIYIRIPNVNGQTTIRLDAEGIEPLTVNKDVTFDTYTAGTFVESVDGEVVIEGDIRIEGFTLTLAQDAETNDFTLVHVGQQGILRLLDGSMIDGRGVYEVGAVGGSHFIYLGDIGDGTVTASINNFSHNKGTGVTTVEDPTAGNGDDSVLFFTHSLRVERGTVNFLDVTPWITSEDLAGNTTSASGGAEVFVDEDGLITGDAAFTIAIEPAGSATGFANDARDAFRVHGDGFINMAIEKVTNGGVRIELPEVGAGALSTNEAGTLFVTRATVFVGSFQNNSTCETVAEPPIVAANTNKTAGTEGCGARTEFWETVEIQTDLVIVGPGEETDPTNGDSNLGTSAVNEFENGVCDGNESGVYFYQTGNVIGNELELRDTDDPGTTCQGEGLFLAATGYTGGPDSIPTGTMGFTTVEGDFSADENESDNFVVMAARGVNPPSKAAGALEGNGWHNLALEGDISFDESPTFVLYDPAQSFAPEVLPLAFCPDDTQIEQGNKFRFTGDNDQLLSFNSNLIIDSVDVLKDSRSDRVEINEDNSAFFVINTSLEIITGLFITNGLLDMQGEGTIVINKSGTDEGILDRGESSRAYANDTTAGPRKVKYVGDEGDATEDEIPGPASGSDAGTEIVVPYLEVALCDNDLEDPDDTPVLTLSKPFTVAEEFRLASGDVEVGSIEFTLENEVLVAIGDGDLARRGNPPFQGNVVFPTDLLGDGFDPGDDGIDLLFFGTVDRPLMENSIYWPWEDIPQVTAPLDVVRNVTVDMTGGDEDGPAVILLEDQVFRMNGTGGDRNPLTPSEADATPFFATGDYQGSEGLRVFTGVLDINGAVLEVNSEGDTEVFVDTDGNLTDSQDPLLPGNPGGVASARADVRAELDKFRAALLAAEGDAVQPSLELYNTLEGFRAARMEAAKSAEHAGLLRFIGTDYTDVYVNTTVSRLRFDFPAIQVNKDDDGSVTLDASGVVATTVPPIAPNRIDVLGTSHFEFVDGSIGGLGTDNLATAGVAMLNGLDMLDIATWYLQKENDDAADDGVGEFTMAGTSSICTGGGCVQSTRQIVEVGEDFIEDDGEFFSNGGDVTVFGNYYLGAEMGAEPGTALFSLFAPGILTVVGDFLVGPNGDTDDDGVADDPTDMDGPEALEAEERNRFNLGGGALWAFGDYEFNGTGDNWDDDSFVASAQGLEGEVFFLGNSQQNVFHRQDEDAFFNHVTMSGEGGILLQEDGWQNDYGTLLLELGIIDTADETWEWILLNPMPETCLANRNAAPRNGTAAGCTATVELGSRDSYIAGANIRVVEFGNATGGIITGGYLFPVGLEGDERQDRPDRRDVDLFAPLILQFADDLGRSSVARVDFLDQSDPDRPGTFEWPDENLVVDANLDDEGEVDQLELDVISPTYFWRLEFDRIPSQDPNIRLQLPEIPNIFDAKQVRIIQWDCDGTNPRLAGVYDLEVDPGIDDPSAALNDFINGVLNVTQEGVNVEACQILGIASNAGINPINLPEITGGFAQVQLIHNATDAGEVDVYVNDNRVWNDASFQTATAFLRIPAGNAEVDIVAATDTDNSNPLVEETLNLQRNNNYVVAVNGSVASGNVGVVVESNARLEPTGTGTEFFIIHGAPDVGQIDIRVLDPANNNVATINLANNLSFGDKTGYRSIDAQGQNIEVTNADNSVQYEVFRFDLSNEAGETFTLLASGEGDAFDPADASSFTLIGFDIFGNPIRPSVVTDVAEETEVPAEFALDGNYPNPFNPSTTIQFDLPATAEVSIEIVDMLGRNVMTLPAQMLEAGSNRTMQVSATSLASGNYLYRVIAKTATDTMIKTGRMTLVK